MGVLLFDEDLPRDVDRILFRDAFAFVQLREVRAFLQKLRIRYAGMIRIVDERRKQARELR